MIWFLYVPLQAIFMVLCWLTNPLVVLFADEDGELPDIFEMWRTWDDSLNPKCYATEMAPKFLRYDWDKHYIEYAMTTPKLAAVGQKRFKAKCINDNFTLKERIKRYLCRVLWIYRNCGYGTAFWYFGATVNTSGVKEKCYSGKDGRSLVIGWDTSQGLWKRPWWIKSDRKITKHIEWNNYLGWKWWNDGTESRRCMIANRIAFKIR